MRLSEYKEMVDKRLPGFLPKPEGYASKLYQAMHYSACAPGKRLRPSLCLLGAEIAGVEAERALPVACALEMIHAYSLIHDDLPSMDDDALRRGRPTCHVVYGEAIALLAGDALLSHAFETMLVCAASASGEKAPYLNAMRYIAKCAGANGMVAGQTADMDHSGIEEAGLAYIHLNKTSKMIMASLVSGIMLGNAPGQMIADFESCAMNLGMAFQITDDVLDITGDEHVLGKPTGSDGRNRKLTAVTLWGIDRAKKKAAMHLTAAKTAIEGYLGAQELILLADGMIDRTF